MSLPVVLVRVGTDVVPVVAGQDERGASVGYDVVRDQVIPLDVGRVVGAVSTDPTAVYWGLDLVEEERGHRMAAEGRYSCFPPGLRDAGEASGISWKREGSGRYRAVVDGRPTEWLALRNDNEPARSDLAWSLHRGDEVEPVKESWSREELTGWLVRHLAKGGAHEADTQPYSRPARGRTSLREFAEQFLANVETGGEVDELAYDDDRPAKIVKALRELGIQDVGDVLGEGSYGTAALLDDTHVIKLTTDQSEVQAGAVLTGKRLTHVAEIYGSWFIRGVRLRMTLDVTEDGEETVKRYAAGVLILQRVQTLGHEETRNLTEAVTHFKLATHTYPHELAKLSRAKQRIKLRQASIDLENLLIATGHDLRDEDRVDEAYLAEDIAMALGELRAEGVYAIDAHGGNVGYIEEDGRVVHKLFDIGSSSPPGEPKAKHVDKGAAKKLVEAGVVEGMVPQSAAAEWIGEGVDEVEVVDPAAEEEGRAPKIRSPLRRGSLVYHGTDSGAVFDTLSGPVWVSNSREVAEWFARRGGGDRADGRGAPRVLTFRVDQAPRLAMIDTDREWRSFIAWVSDGEDENDPYELADRVCQKSLDGWHIGANYPEGSDTMLCDPGRILEFVSVEELPVMASEDREMPARVVARPSTHTEVGRLPTKLAPQGQKFAPLDLPLFGAQPVVTGYAKVRPQLLKHREQIPSAETITLSTVFSGLTIMVGIDQAERGFACVARMYEKLGRGRMPTIDEIRDCIVPLGFIKQRTAMYETASAWAPVVREAMKSGMRDRELRRHLYLQTELPEGIGIAKLSFILALSGQDTICLDSRLLNRMFGDAQGKKMSSSFNAQHSEATLRRYEEVEDAFLDGNPFYDAKDPIGRARCQWQSWEQSGSPPKPASHSVWLNVVQ